jgi:hypothetical protein
MGTVPIFVALLVLHAGAPAALELIDRVLAVAAGQVITLSDVRAAAGLRLVDVGSAADPTGAVLDRLIDRELALQEVNRYLPPEPDPEHVDRRLAEIRSRFATPDALNDVFRISGMNEARLREHVRDDLRLETYLSQRFGAGAQPTDEEVARYFEQRQAEFGDRPFAEIREQLRQRMAREQRQAVIERWIADLRRRSDVIRLYLPDRRGAAGSSAHVTSA